LSSSQAYFTGGIVGTIVIAGLTGFGLHFLILLYERYVDTPKGKPVAALAVADETARDEGEERWSKEEITFTRLAELTLGPSGKTMVQITIVVAQFGCMMAYCIYLGTVGTLWVPSIPEWVWVLLLYPVFLAVCQLREIKMLIDWASVGVSVCMVCMIGTVVLCLVGIAENGVADVNAGVDVSKFPTFFGVVFFAMEGITVVLPVVHSMKEPKQAHSMVMVVLCVVTLSYMCIGVAAYLAYGSKTVAPMTENMPAGSVNDTIGIMMAVVVMVTFPIQCYPLSQMADDIWPNNPQLIRAGAVTIPTVAAIVCPFMGETLGIIGGVSMTMLGCSIPFCMYLAEFGATMSIEKKYSIYLALSVGSLLGLLATIESSIALFQEPGFST